MKFYYKILAFLSNLNIGLSAPFLSLILCEHGCTLQNIGLVIAIFSVTVVISEVPSGIFADLFGRKFSFILAQIFGLVSSGILLLSHSFILTVTGFIFYGLFTAFSSGSLDALAIEDSMKNKGKDAIFKAVSSFQIYSCAGVAIGAFISGFLPYINGYIFHLSLKMLISFFTIFISAALLHENSQLHKTVSSTESAADVFLQMSYQLKTHLHEMYSVLKSSVLKRLIVCMIAMALIQASIETYWQPQLSSFQLSTLLLPAFSKYGNGSDDLHTILGFLSASAYLATILGCTLIGKSNISNTKKTQTIYLGTACSIMGCTTMLSFTTQAFTFSSFYILIYFFIGVLSVAEQTLINHETNDQTRASVLSITSFFSRIGVIVSGILSSLILLNGTIPIVWLLFSCSTLIVILFFAKPTKT